jgi:hypothetical protein
MRGKNQELSRLAAIPSVITEAGRPSQGVAVGVRFLLTFLTMNFFFFRQFFGV